MLKNINKRQTLLIIFAVVLLIIIALVVYLAQNTSLFFSISNENLIQNNENIVSSPSDLEADDQGDLNTLTSTSLIISDQFKKGVFSQPRNLNLPEGFEISVWAIDLRGARAIDFTAKNNIVVTAKNSGEVYLIKYDLNSEISGEKVLIDRGLRTPHGIDYYNGDLYVAEETRVIVYRKLTEEGKFETKDVIISNLPSGGHSTRTILVGPDEKLYVSIGSSCNLCEEKDSRRAAIVRYNLDGSEQEIFAAGLRNTVDFISKEGDSNLQFWGVDNGRDELGDDLPPEEVNSIRESQHYGWPYCYGNQINNPEYPTRKDFCLNETQSPIYNMQAHSAPLGLTFVPEASTDQLVNFPKGLKDDLFVTFHGSWNRTVPTGYKVVRINSGSTQSEPVNFITGWLDSSGVWGRPVGIRFDLQGNMFIADDQNGVIYKVKYIK